MQTTQPFYVKTTCIALALCCMLSSLTACGNIANSTPTSKSETAATKTRYSTVFYDYFDTVTTVIAYTETEEDFNTHIAFIQQELAEYHKLYDIYKSYNGVTNLKTVNETAALAPVKVDKKIFDLLVEAKEIYTLTNGKVNIAMGSVLTLWHDSRTAGIAAPETATLPDETALSEAATHTNLDDLILDAQNSTVFFADPALQLDVGSCGKGYACEEIAREAEENGLDSALFGLGGNLRGIGTKPDGAPWVGGVEDPWAMAKGENADYLIALELTDAALVVSGDYQRFYTVDGTRYHHLIDPATLMPATYFNSVSVLTRDSGRADCLSTALFCMPLDEGQALVDSLVDVEALWCLPNGEAIASSGLTAFEHKK